MKARIGGLMVLLMVVILAISGMVPALFWGVNEVGNDLAQGQVEPQQTKTGVDVTRNDIPLATLLYIGFGLKWNEKMTGDEPRWVPKLPEVSGLGTRGWNVIGDTFYEGLTFGQSEIGWYASDDEATIAWQLDQMQRAGIRVIYISWQGWGDDDLDGMPNEGSIAVSYDRTAKKILRYIRDHRLPFQFGILVEDFPSDLGQTSPLNLSDESRNRLANKLWDDFFDPENPDGFADIAYLKDGKPLVFGRAHTPGSWWENHHFQDDRLIFYRSV